MKNKTFLLIHSSIYACFAIGLFIIPDTIWPLYGMEINDQYARFLSQHNSIFLGGITAIGFLFRDVEAKSLAAQQIFKGLLLTNILGVTVTLYACLNEIFVGFGWSDPAFFVLLVILSFGQLRKNC